MKNTEAAYYEFMLLLTADETLSRKTAAELAESDNDANAFFTKNYGAFFAARGIEKPGHEEQTLCYLLDVLIEAGFVHELDWKADADNLNFAVEEMSGGKITEVVDEDDEEDAEGMFDLLEEAHDRLGDLGFALIEFPLNSDSHPIALVPLEKEEALNAMIDQLFGGE